MAFPELVIFDCDGVLIDSEILSIKNLVAELEREYGLIMPIEEALNSYVGKSHAFEVSDLKERYGIAYDASFHEKKKQTREILFEKELKAIPGVEALINSLSMSKCVASSSTPERLRHSLGRVNLWGAFAPHIFSATQVKHGKPAPDLFLFAAQQMGVSPAGCLVIEDSVAGIQAARAAGMKVFGFTGGSHCGIGHGELLLREGAAAVFDHMDDVARALIPVSGHGAGSARVKEKFIRKPVCLTTRAD